MKMYLKMLCCLIALSIVSCNSESPNSTDDSKGISASVRDTIDVYVTSIDHSTRTIYTPDFTRYIVHYSDGNPLNRDTIEYGDYYFNKMSSVLNYDEFVEIPEVIGSENTAQSEVLFTWKVFRNRDGLRHSTFFPWEDIPSVLNDEPLEVLVQTQMELHRQ